MKGKGVYEMPYVGCLVGAAFMRMIGRLETTLRHHHLNITAGEYMILRALYSRDCLQQCEIAEMVGKDKSAISRSVAAMSKKGLVSTEPVSYKCVRVSLTPRALEIKPKVMEVAALRHQALLDLAPEADIDAFVRVLKAIIDEE